MSRRSKIRQHISSLSGGGGGSGNVGRLRWGPDFGSAQPKVNTEIDLVDINLTGNLSANVEALITDINIAYEEISIDTSLALAIAIGIEDTPENVVQFIPGNLLINAFNVESDIDVSEYNIAPEYDLINASADDLIDQYLANYLAYADSNDLTSGGWASPENALANTTGTSAQMTVSSSGLAGLTSNTVSGEIKVGFRNPSELSTLYTLGDTIIINIERALISAGLVPLGQGADLDWQVSIDGGSSWTTVQNDTSAVAKGTISLNITSLVGTAWSRINSLQVRSNGSITSGSGIGVSLTAHFYRTWVTFEATYEP